MLKSPRVAWPAGEGPRIFACLRPDTRHVKGILSALAGNAHHRVVCVAPGFKREVLQSFVRPNVVFVTRPIDLQAMSDADPCITYGAEGTMLTFLLAGVPQLIAPWHVETYMAARRVEAAGLGVAIPDGVSPEWIAAAIERLPVDGELRRRVGVFAERARGYSIEGCCLNEELAA